MGVSGRGDCCAVHAIAAKIRRIVVITHVCALVVVSSNNAVALDESVRRIHGDASRTRLGDGTGVIVGVIDSGIDVTHPALAGTDSLGYPRLVAEGNFVRTEPAQSADDVFGHGTSVAGVILSSDALFTGLAPDARFINSRVLDRQNGFQSSDWVIDGIGFAVANGADVLNLSLNLFAATSHGNTRLDLVADWVAYELEVPVAACVGNISQASNGSTLPRAPGAAFNTLSVGRTTRNFDYDYGRVDSDSAHGPTSDGRVKPDLVAPGNGISTLNDDWEVLPTTADDYRNQSGCSFATPHVTGMIAQQLEYGAANALSLSPLVIRSTLLNSAEKVYGRLGNPWQPAGALEGEVWHITEPLDRDSGAGQIDGAMLADQYQAGQFAPGAVPDVGWDLNVITGESALDYALPDSLSPGGHVAATLTWARHVRRIDLNGNEMVDAADSFAVSATLDNLDLTLLRDGEPVVTSASLVDNVEHLIWRLDEPGAYSLRVSRLFVDGSGDDEPFSLAWRTFTPLPVPGDTNGDHRVDIADLNNVRNNFGSTGLDILGDTYPFDGRVGIEDLNAIRNDFGFAAPCASVPEPDAMSLLAVAIAILIAISQSEWRLNRKTC
jgi:subtilisin family serine protease